MRVAQQQANDAHERVQGLLNASELALAAGQLQAARTAYDEARFAAEKILPCLSG